jgi:hypothetical protein
LARRRFSARRASFCLALAEFAQVVGAAGARIASLADGDGVQSGVELSVAAGVQPVRDPLSAGGVQRCGAGVDGEVTAAGEADDVADLAEDLRCSDHSNAVDAGSPLQVAASVSRHPRIRTGSTDVLDRHRRIYQTCGGMPPAELEAAHYRHHAALAEAGHSTP